MDTLKINLEVSDTLKIYLEFLDTLKINLEFLDTLKINFEFLDIIKDILEFYCDFSWNFYYCAVPFLKALNFWSFESVSFFTIGTFNTRVLSSG